MNIMGSGGNIFKIIGGRKQNSLRHNSAMIIERWLFLHVYEA